MDQKKKFSVSMIYIILEFNDFTSLGSASKKYRIATFPFDLAANFNWPKPFKDRDQDQPLIYWSITEPSAWSRVTTSRGVSGHISMAFGFNSSPIPGASDIVR